MIGALAIGTVAGVFLGNAVREEEIIVRDDESLVVSIENGVSWLTKKVFRAGLFVAKVGLLALAATFAFSTGKWALGLIAPALGSLWSGAKGLLGFRALTAAETATISSFA